MIVPTLPTLQGLAYPIMRTPIWSAINQQFESGKRARFSLWNYPQYRCTLPYQFLRNTAAEFQTLLAFFNTVNGSAGLFQFNDPDDNTATNVEIAIGDGSKTTFQLYRSIGAGIGWYDPVFAVTGSPTIMQNGVATPPAGGISATGVVTFGAPPASGTIISWTGTYNWYARFDADTIDFEKFLSTMWRAKALVFTTEKLLQ